ncbi:MAG: hypothetical protein AAFZ67_01420 [Planctomycetota bacterium]
MIRALYWTISVLVTSVAFGQLGGGNQAPTHNVVLTEVTDGEIIQVTPAVPAYGSVPYEVVIHILYTGSASNYLSLVDYEVYAGGSLVYTESIAFDTSVSTVTGVMETPTQQSGSMALNPDDLTIISPPPNMSALTTQSAWAREKITHANNAIANSNAADIMINELEILGCGSWLVKLVGGSGACCVNEYGSGTAGCGICCQSAVPDPGPQIPGDGVVDEYVRCRNEALNDQCNRSCDGDLLARPKLAIDLAGCRSSVPLRIVTP